MFSPEHTKYIRSLSVIFFGHSRLPLCFRPLPLSLETCFCVDSSRRLALISLTLDANYLALVSAMIWAPVMRVSRPRARARRMARGFTAREACEEAVYAVSAQYVRTLHVHKSEEIAQMTAAATSFLPVVLGERVHVHLRGRYPTTAFLCAIEPSTKMKDRDKRFRTVGNGDVVAEFCQGLWRRSASLSFPLAGNAHCRTRDGFRETGIGRFEDSA